MSRSLKAWLGELVGTFMFVTIGAGAVILATAQLTNYGLLGVALAHGLAIGSVITVFGSVSGAHLNPAVTLSAWIGRKIETPDALGYVACQIFGALGAGLVLRVFFQESVWRASNLGAPALSVSAGRGVLVEAVLTFVFVMVIWGTGLDDRGPRVGGFAIGLTLAALILAFGPLTGVALNPARFLGPAAVAGNVDDWWVYFVGPGIGASAAGIVYQTLFWDGFPLARPTVDRPAAPAQAAPEPRLAAARKEPARKAPARKRPARKR